jgi:thiol-disulfide isomerase/thioredoxin
MKKIDLTSISRKNETSLMRKIWLSGLSLLVLFLLASCDIVEAPFLENHDSGGGVTENPRKVLLFDFTGHTCKSCPKAHKSIDQLKQLYGDRLVPVAFHLGYFAKPLAGGKFSTDFRTPEGELLEKHFDFVAFPTGTVQTLANDQLQPYSAWPSIVSENIVGDSPIKIGITHLHFSPSGELTAVVSVTALQTIPGAMSLAVYVLEDGVADWQKDEDFDPMDIPFYQHHHVFRTSLNGLWGERIGGDSGMQKGVNENVELAKLLNPAWKAENCMVIAFVYQNLTKRIIQVESSKLNLE